MFDNSYHKSNHFSDTSNTYFKKNSPKGLNLPFGERYSGFFRNAII